MLKLRAETKRIAKESPREVARRLEHQQFALKYFANVPFGPLKGLKKLGTVRKST